MRQSTISKMQVAVALSALPQGALLQFFVKYLKQQSKLSSQTPDVSGLMLH